MAYGGDVAWAQTLREQLASEIELIGLAIKPPVEERDRLVDLRRRLQQVDRLINATASLQESGGWPADLGDPSDQASDEQSDSAQAH
jgi:hypothetical protein